MSAENDFKNAAGDPAIRAGPALARYSESQKVQSEEDRAHRELRAQRDQEIEQIQQPLLAHQRVAITENRPTFRPAPPRKALTICGAIFAPAADCWRNYPLGTREPTAVPLAKETEREKPYPPSRPFLFRSQKRPDEEFGTARLLAGL